MLDFVYSSPDLLADKEWPGPGTLGMGCFEPQAQSLRVLLNNLFNLHSPCTATTGTCTAKRLLRLKLECWSWIAWCGFLSFLWPAQHLQGSKTLTGRQPVWEFSFSHPYIIDRNLTTPFLENSGDAGLAAAISIVNYPFSGLGVEIAHGSASSKWRRFQPPP